MHKFVFASSFLVYSSIFALPQTDLDRINETISFLVKNSEMRTCSPLEVSSSIEVSLLQKDDIAKAIKNADRAKVGELIQVFASTYTAEEKTQYLEMSVSYSSLVAGIPWLFICKGVRFKDVHAATWFAQYEGLESSRTTLEYTLGHAPEFFSSKDEAFYRRDLGAAAIFFNDYDAARPQRIARTAEELSQALAGDWAVFYKIVRVSQIHNILREGLDPRYGGKNGASEAAKDSFHYLAAHDTGKMFVGLNPWECLGYFDLLKEDNKVYLLRLRFPLEDFGKYRMSVGGQSGGWYFQGKALSSDYIEVTLIDASGLERTSTGNVNWDQLPPFEFHNLAVAALTPPTMRAQAPDSKSSKNHVWGLELTTSAPPSTAK